MCALALARSPQKRNFLTANEQLLQRSCILSAQPYQYANEWMRNCSNSFQHARNNGWLVECTNHMFNINNCCRKTCIEAAASYHDEDEWIRYDIESYLAAVKNDWLKHCSFKPTYVKKSDAQIKIDCINSTKKYKSCRDWMNREHSRYKTARINLFLADCFQAINERCLFNEAQGWQYRLCRAKSKIFDNEKMWERNDITTYRMARCNGWMLEFSERMRLRSL